VIDAIAAGDKSCTACHDMAAHPYPAAVHQASVADDPIAGILTDPAGSPLFFFDGTVAAFGGQQCGECHLMDLLAEHTKPSSSVAAAACAACHPTPRDTFGDWNQTCQQGGCHSAVYHGQMAAKHYQAIPGRNGCGGDDADCHISLLRDVAGAHAEEAHFNAYYWSGQAGPNGCDVCHGSATVVPAPVTTCRMAGCHDGADPEIWTHF
jgi:hypothetical protein